MSRISVNSFVYYTDDVDGTLQLGLSRALDRDLVDAERAHQWSLMHGYIGDPIYRHVGLAAKDDAAFRCHSRLGQLQRVKLPVSRCVPCPKDYGDYRKERYADHGHRGNPHHRPEQVFASFGIDFDADKVGIPWRVQFHVGSFALVALRVPQSAGTSDDA